MTQPTRVGTILYLFYTLLCHAATYLASVVKQAMRQIQAETFAVKGPMLVIFAAFVVLGLLWAGERPISLHASRGAVIAARLVGAAVQTWLCLAFYFGVIATAVDMAGTLPVSALLTGGLLIGVIEALCRTETE